MNKMHIAVGLLILVNTINAAVVFQQLPEPPVLSDVSDYIHIRVDYGIKTQPISKDNFMAALTNARFFSTTPDDVYKNEKFPYDNRMGNYKGVFSLKDGRLFLWHIPRHKIVEIEDSKGKIGWYELDVDIIK